MAKPASKSLPRISESEWVVMKELWNKHPQTAGELIQGLEGQTSWSPATIKTLLNRLVGKGALGFEKQGREYLYHPLVEEKACVHAESASFLDRVFGGALAPMLANFLEQEKISKEELEKLKQLLNSQEKLGQEKQGKEKGHAKPRR